MCHRMSPGQLICRKVLTAGIWTGPCCQPEKTGRGAKRPPPPNLAISSHMTIKLGRGIL